MVALRECVSNSAFTDPHGTALNTTVCKSYPRAKVQSFGEYFLRESDSGRLRLGRVQSSARKKRKHAARIGPLSHREIRRVSVAGGGSVPQLSKFHVMI